MNSAASRKVELKVEQSPLRPEATFGSALCDPYPHIEVDMDSADFHAAVYDKVREIPPQRVTTYGYIAKLIGMPNHSRHVGQALKFVSPQATPPVPWHRVIGASGTISSRGPGTDGAQRQKDELEAEGVEVTIGRTGEFRVDLLQWGWFPVVPEA